MPGLTIGTAVSRPGRIVSGWFGEIRLPSGGADRFPIIIAQGRQDGPVFWVTTGMHGTEHTGPVVIQEFIDQALVKELRGTLIAVPALNPAGLRNRQRTAYYLDTDPNRLFPKPNQAPQKTKSDDKPRHDLELAFRALYEQIVQTQPAALLDLHNASIGSLPFTLRDPVFFHLGRGKNPTRQQAVDLQTKVSQIVDAFGFTAINEFAAESYTAQHLDRSVSGSVLNGAGIPALTVELGSWMFVDAGIVQACKSGLRNVLRWAGMLDGAMEPITGIPMVQPGYAVRRADHIYAPETGIVHHMVRPGEVFVKNQPLFRMTDIFGHSVGANDGIIRSHFDGFAYGWNHGVVRYRGETVMMLAVRDNEELVVPYPA